MLIYLVLKVCSILMLYIQIWHVVVTGFQGVPYFKVTLNSHVLKSYVEFKFFTFP